MNNKILPVTILIIIVIFILLYISNMNKNIKNETTKKDIPVEKITKLPPPYLTIDKTKKYKAILKTTEGDITVSLNAEKTPITVNNFIYLARNKFYDNTIFHRVIKDFMIQGGDPNGDGTGGPGYKFDDESFSGDYERGVVAMANAGPNTNGSQFFIMHQNYFLPKNYVIFGKVEKGIEVVDKIANAKTEANIGSGEMSKPASPVTANTIEIIEE